MSLHEAKDSHQKAEDHFDTAIRHIGAGVEEYIKLYGMSYDLSKDAVVALRKYSQREVEEYKSIVLTAIDKKMKELKSKK